MSKVSESSDDSIIAAYRLFEIDGTFWIKKINSRSF